MGELFVMRRANRDLFAERRAGKLRIPVWSSVEGALRFKARNPDLFVFIPTRLDLQTLRQVEELEEESAAEFFLLSEDTPDADLDEGRPVKLAEIFPDRQLAS